MSREKTQAPLDLQSVLFGIQRALPRRVLFARRLGTGTDACYAEGAGVSKCLNEFDPVPAPVLAFAGGLWIAGVPSIFREQGMIDPTVLLTYSLIVLSFVFIPGPATLLTVARATTSGTKVGIATGAGITAGDFLHTIMAVVGISAVIAASATLFTIVKYLGAAYLLYLGLKAIFAKNSIDLLEWERPMLYTRIDLGQGRIPITAPQAFRQAILAEVMNPKTALFFLAFLPQFVSPEKGFVVLQLSILGVVFALMGFFCTIVYSIAAGGLGNFLRRNPTVLKWQGKVVGGIYCALGIRLAFQER